MKKLLAILLACALAFAATACGESGGSSSQDSGGTSQEGQKSEVETPKEASIEEQVLFEDADIKITATKLELDGFVGAELNLLIENNTDQDLTFQVRDVSVNGYMVDPICSSDVAAGKKMNDTISFMESDFEACGITDIADIELSFHIFTTDDWETYLDTDPIQIKTSLADGFNYTYDDSGEPLYEGNGIKVVSKGLAGEDGYLGKDLLLYIENTSDQTITVQLRDVSVNGFMVNPIMSQTVLPGKYAVTEATFMDSDLEDNNITTITDIELSILIYNYNTFDDIVQTDPIKLTF